MLTFSLVSKLELTTRVTTDERTYLKVGFEFHKWRNRGREMLAML